MAPAALPPLGAAANMSLPLCALLVPALIVSPERYTFRSTTCLTMHLQAATTAATSPPPVKPALLAGTPPVAADFPFSAEQLIEKAKEVHAGDTGINDDSVLAPDFRFE